MAPCESFLFINFTDWNYFYNSKLLKNFVFNAVQYSISENLQKNKKTKSVFWKDWAFPFNMKHFKYPKRFLNSLGDI